jgi:hypothetical protein
MDGSGEAAGSVTGCVVCAAAAEASTLVARKAARTERDTSIENSPLIIAR